MSATSRSESPQPRSSMRSSACARESDSIHGFQMGLCHSNSRWVSQCGALTSAGPSPVIA